MTNEALSQLRIDYQMAALDITDVSADPLAQFKQWLLEASSSALPEPNALTLATVDAEGKPSARVVLLKEIDTGFVFYTNYESRKGQEIEQNQEVAMVFLWLDLQRQVRVTGRAEKIDRAQSEAYFISRPKTSQIAAWASPQSQVVPGRAFLEQAYLDAETRFADNETLPTPPHWGGYRVLPTAIEFWQGRGSRMHDRILYSLQPNGAWRLERLAP